MMMIIITGKQTCESSATTPSIAKEAPSSSLPSLRDSSASGMIRKAEADGGEASGSGPPPAGADGEESAAAAAAAVGDLVAALSRRRVYREVTLALRSGLRDAQADFSFLRTRGLRRLLKFLRSSAAAAASDESLRLFRHSQSLPDLQGFSLPRLSFFQSRVSIVLSISLALPN